MHVICLVSRIYGFHAQCNAKVTQFHINFEVAYARAVAKETDVLESKDSSLDVSFEELLIDFVSTIDGLSLAEAPAFKMTPGEAPANVAVSITKLGGSSTFIRKEN
ncbi:hypothetical protein AMTR_s00108p00088220 [Amborella trichopoda]|uniref:Carbohydrate kinase PfkB domain-containing protein n=1 Tax=Amborella trichopoda TaxID=13333 RepID=W1NUQ6_AMBTC|nr:hypothetical protein AMTR_s00108p00088220 [Amborella trichopoda]